MCVAVVKAGQFMARRQVLFLISLAVAGLIPSVSFALSGQWPFAIPLLVFIGLMLYSNRSSKPLLAHICLAGFSIIFAIGVVLNTSLVVMVIAMAAGLASWDLVQEIQSKSPTTLKYERYHLQYLGIAFGMGLLGVGAFHWLQIRLPFGVMLALGIIMLVSINQFITYIQKRTGSPS